MSQLYIYNTLERAKVPFEPVAPPYVGLYVCGPTVYGDPHLGHARLVIIPDILFCYLKHFGYKMRYACNVTDVGHLEYDVDDGEDKITKKAKLERLEPMEVAYYYLNRYYDSLRLLNVLPPSIESLVSGHITEQTQLVQQIPDADYAYVSEGSVYFDVLKYHADHPYGILSGRNVEGMISNTRESDGQDEKHNPLDFASWKKVQPSHIMRWPSSWSEGFPGWHYERIVMGRKYLGAHFGIHGGGPDLTFPHYECEIVRVIAPQGEPAVKYWMHNNMITVDGKKMAKSAGGSITLEEFFTGNHPILEQVYAPTTIHFFVLSAHYRGTVDFSNSALQAAGEGYQRFMDADAKFQSLKPSATLTTEKTDLAECCRETTDDDISMPMMIAAFFDAIRLVNSIHDGHEQIMNEQLEEPHKTYDFYLHDILGIQSATEVSDLSGSQQEASARAVDLPLDIRSKAKVSKGWETSDLIRGRLTVLGFEVQGTKSGAEWKVL